MKRAHLVRRIGRAAREAGLMWAQIRSGSRHEIWECDGLRVSLPRHREIDEDTARGIMRFLEEKLGEDWWR